MILSLSMETKATVSSGVISVIAATVEKMQQE